MDERVARWGSMTLVRLAELSTDPATGVHLATGIAASAAQRNDPFDWVTALKTEKWTPMEEVMRDLEIDTDVGPADESAA